MQPKTKCIILEYCFDHVEKEKFLSKLDHCCAVIVHMCFNYCSVSKAVDGTHFVRNLIRNDQTHQDLNKIIIMMVCHYRARRFDL